MAFHVVFLGRAKREVHATMDWLKERSATGAAHWLQALEGATQRLEQNPLACGLADEDELAQMEIRQILFKTRRGKPFRALFQVVGNEVRILHVRGPGQAPLTSGDVPSS
jgi:plasmid stabilization system protein ParE